MRKLKPDSLELSQVSQSLMTTSGAGTLKERFDALDASAGFVNGALPIWSGANYVASASSLRGAISVLDNVLAGMVTSHNGILQSDLDANGHTVKNMRLPVTDDEGASKKYVDQRVGTTQVNLDAVYEELNGVEVAAGLDANGNFPPVTYSYHLNGISNLRQGLLTLDAAVATTYLRRDGGSLSGAVYTSVPFTNDYQLINKKYVDDKYAAVSNTEHNALHGLQGGYNPNSEYYHLSYNDVLKLGSLTNYHSQLVGLSGGDYASGFWHLTQDEHSVTQAMVTEWKNNGNNFGVVGAAIAHNALASIQGGNGTDQFYHLTQYNHTRLSAMVSQWDANGQNFIGVAGSHNGLTGLQGGAAGSFYHLDYGSYSTLGSMISVWYANGNKFIDGSTIDHNTLNNIQGGQAGERYHFNLNQHQTLLDVAAQWTANGSSFVTNNNMGTVVITSPQVNQVLTYDGTKWVNQSPTATTSFAALTDVQLTSLTANQVPQWNGSKWVNVTLPYSTLLSGLTDTSISGQTVGQVLKWNGTRWVNADLPLASDTSLGVVKVGAGLSIDVNGVLSASGGGGGSANLSGLTDVSVSNIVAGQMLVHDGSRWTNATLKNAVLSSLGSDPYWSSVRLLLKGNEGAGATVPLDVSSYGYSCSFVGSNYSVDVTNKKYGSGSYWFQGDYTSLTALVTTHKMQLGTGDFTAETWFNYESYVSWWPTIFACRSSDNTQPLLQVSVDYTTRQLVLYTRPLNGSLLTQVISGTTISTMTWYHVSVSRIAGTLRVFLNGVLVFTTTDTNDYTSDTAVWQLSNAGTGGWWNGWIDDFRLTEGVGRYSANYNVPLELYGGHTSVIGLNLTGLLDVTVSNPQSGNVLQWDGSKWVNGTSSGGSADPKFGNVTLLLNFDHAANTTYAGIADGSTYARAALSGSALVTTSQARFGTGALSTTGTTGLRYSSSPDFRFSGDFTAEMFVYLTGAQTNGGLLSSGGSTWAGGEVVLRFNNSNSLVCYEYGAGLIASSSDLSLNAWHHVALVRVGTTVLLFIDGVLSSTVTTTAVLNFGSNGTVIGYNPFDLSSFNGIVDSLRITTGFARYTSNFVVPTGAFPGLTTGLSNLSDVSINAPTTGQLLGYSGSAWTQVNVQGLSRIDSTMALLNFEGTIGSTTITDSAAINPRSWATAGNAQLSANQVKFGTTALYLDGSGNWVQTTTVSDLAFAADFTLAGWFYAAKNNVVLVDAYSASKGFQLYLGSTNYLMWYKNGGTLLTSSVTTPLNAWNHVEITKSGSTINMYLNGTRVATATDSTAYDLTGISVVALGAQVSTRTASYDFQGYLDSWIIANKAFHTGASFTVPTAAYSASSTALNDYGISLSGMLDVSVNSPAIGNVLQWNGSKWVNGVNPVATSSVAGVVKPSATGFSVAGDGTLTLNAPLSLLSDVQIATLTSGQILQWNGTKWANVTAPWPSNVSAMSDVQLSALTTNDVLQWNGSKWVNGPSPGGGGGGSSTLSGLSDVALTTLSTNQALTFNGTRWVNSTIYGLNSVDVGDPYVSGVVLLMTGEGTDGGTDFVDAKGHALTVSGSGITATSAQKKFGATSIVYPGTSSYLQVASSIDFNFAVADFAMEMWVNPASQTQTYPQLLASSGTWTTNDWQLTPKHPTTGNKIAFWAYNYSSSAPLLTSSSDYAVGVWTHVAVTRQGNTWRLFVNGILEAVSSAAITLTSGAIPLQMGRYYIGYIDGVRVTTGYPRYTVGFNVPTSEFSLTATVSVLGMGVSSLTDVTVSTPSYGQALVWNGTKWTNGTATAVSSFRVATTTYAATMNLDWSGADEQQITLLGNLTLGNMVGGINGQRMMLRLKQDGTGGRTLTISGTNIRKPSSMSILSLTPTPNAIDRIGLVYDGTDGKYDIVAFANDLR